MEYLEQYKFSMFNHKVFKDGKLFLYNAYSGGFCMCDDIMKKTFKDIFNLQATAILLMYLQGNEDMEIVENVKILNKNVSDEIVLEFIADLKSKF